MPGRKMKLPPPPPQYKGGGGVGVFPGRPLRTRRGGGGGGGIKILFNKVAHIAEGKGE